MEEYGLLRYDVISEEGAVIRVVRINLTSDEIRDLSVGRVASERFKNCKIPDYENTSR